jgi:hypothetical protein
VEGANRWEKTPEIIDAIEILLEHDTAGDPITGLKWTRKTTEKIAAVLQEIDIPVSANTVARLLYQMNFSLRVNRKQIATNSSPYRDQQFQHIGSLRTRFQRQGLPIISVDSKKRELIGNFKNAGAKWGRSPVAVNDHDFGSDASGVGISYGIYDEPHNRIASLGACSQASGLGGLRWQQVAGPGHGRPKSRLSCATPSVSPLRSLTIPPAPPNGTPSSIAYSPRSPRTGLLSHWTATTKCSTSFVLPVPKPDWL